MLHAVFPGTHIGCAINMDICSLAIVLVIFPVSNIETFTPDLSAIAWQQTITPLSYPDIETIFAHLSTNTMKISIRIDLTDDPTVFISSFFPIWLEVCLGFELWLHFLYQVCEIQLAY